MPYLHKSENWQFYKVKFKNGNNYLKKNKEINIKLMMRLPSRELQEGNMGEEGKQVASTIVIFLKESSIK